MRKLAYLCTAATLALSCLPATAKATEPVKYCTGLKDGNYDFTGIAVKQQNPTGVVLVNTKGSLENMEKVNSGECQAAPVQSDAYYVFMANHSDAALNVERARDMYPEYGHLICNTSSVTELSDLKRGNTVLVGPPGSGSSVMWEAIVRANDKYKQVSTLPMGGARALGKVSDGQEAQCMLYVAGLKSPSMIEANKVAATASGHLRLVSMRDSKLFDLKDAKGRQIYEKAEIPDSTYPNGLQASGMFTNGAAVDTIRVQSVLVDNVQFAEAHEDALNAFLTAMNKAMPAINDRVLPK